MRDPFMSCVIYAIEALIYNAFFSRISVPRFCRWKCVLIGICLFEIGSAFNLCFHNAVVVNTIVIIPIIAVYFKLCFDVSIKMALLYSLVLDAVNFAIELIAIYGFSSILSVPATAFQNDLALLMLEATSCKSLFFLVCLLFSNWAHGTSAQKIPVSLFIYPICVTACLIASCYTVTEIQNRNGKVILAVASGLLLVSLIFLFNTFQHEIEKDALLIKAQQENAHLKTEKEYYDILERQNQNLMLYAHDTRKHLNAIRELSHDPGINDYVSKLYGELSAYSQTCHSGNKLLDVIVNRYVLDCALKEINFEYNVRECPLNILEDLDLVAILGNLMDNAITAAGQSAKKVITFTTSVRNTYNVIVLRNSCDSAPWSKGERLYSTKENPRLHGYGLQSVKRTVKKYGGTFIGNLTRRRILFQ